MSYKVPCIVYCRDMAVPDAILEVADKAGVPILRTKQTTSSFSSELNRWLKVELAPRISIHGVLVDIYGEGVLITGESGIGKSEVALELIHRGHRLVSDDVVEIKKVSDATLIGTAPDITRHFIELRGIGIIDAKALFGVESVKIPSRSILSLNSKSGTKSRITTAWDWKKNTSNISEIKWYAIRFRFVRGEILQSFVSRQPSISVRKRWVIMQRKNCTIV